jgi:hypothetical protein
MAMLLLRARGQGKRQSMDRASSGDNAAVAPAVLKAIVAVL